MFLTTAVRLIRQKIYLTEHEKVLAQWWKDRGDYTLRLDYELDKNSFVMDLGGYSGQWASDIYSRYCCRVAIFEPVDRFADNIRVRFAKNDKMQVYQYCLGCYSRMETISVCGTGSSVFKKAEQSEPIKIIDVAEWFADENITSVQLMKINIEGGEYELMERLIATGLVNIVENIQVQFHEISGDSAERMKNIQASLKKTHTPIYQYRFVWENWERK
jgi:FkbM family methyltransferase